MPRSFQVRHTQARDINSISKVRTIMTLQKSLSVLTAIFHVELG